MFILCKCRRRSVIPFLSMCKRRAALPFLSMCTRRAALPLLLLAAAFLLVPVPVPHALADEWIETDEGRKYRYDDGSFAAGGWKWIDGDRDCVTECYYFHEDGSIAVNTKTEDGYEVDETGAWIENGEVQTHDTQLTIAVTGDNLIHQELISFGLASGGFDFLYGGDLAEELRQADLAVLSQETIYVNDPALYSGYPAFGTPLAVGEAALRAGFSLAACATNHSMDKGIAAIDTTARFYEEHQIPYIGIQPSARPEYEPWRLLTVNGVRLALFDYTYGTNGIRIPERTPHAVHLLTDPARVRADIAAAREQADAVIVFVHWGEEYTQVPNASQRAWTGVFLESGVDVVVGTHPHVLQPVQLFERENAQPMLVFYSLGNMVSRQGRPQCSIGGLAEFTITRTPEGCGVTEYELKPVITHQSWNSSTAGLLENYTPELAAAHRMGLSLEEWHALFDKWSGGTGSYWGEPSLFTRKKWVAESAAKSESAVEAAAAAEEETSSAESESETAAAGTGYAVAAFFP